MGDEQGNPARVLARLARQVEHALAEQDLSIQQYRLLAYLSHGDWAASLLADKLDVSKPSITALVDGLVKRGGVERRPGDGDRRRIDHVITKQGKAALAAGDRAVNDRLEALAAHLPGDALAEALRALAAVEEVLDANLREALAR